MSKTLEFSDKIKVAERTRSQSISQSADRTPRMGVSTEICDLVPYPQTQWPGTTLDPSKRTDSELLCPVHTNCHWGGPKLAVMSAIRSASGAFCVASTQKNHATRSDSRFRESLRVGRK